MSKLVLIEGAIFAGRYRIARCIAMGGMGAVYEVVHLETERRRALKVMLPNFVESPELRERFRQEARVAAHIESEHIVDVFDAGIDDETGLPFLVMELLRGIELGKKLRASGRFEPQEALTYLDQVARVLDKTHRAAIVHRDLKPENLFLTEREDGRPLVKILDFGIAKFIAEGSTGANATCSIGTPMYMAPEQFKTGAEVYPSADIFALGMLAYTLLVGTAYWKEEARGGNVFAFAVKAMHGPEEAATERARRHGAELPATFDQWFMVATATNPAARFSTAGQAITELAAALKTRSSASGPLAPDSGQRPDIVDSRAGSKPIHDDPPRGPLPSTSGVDGALSSQSSAPAASPDSSAPAPPPSSPALAIPHRSSKKWLVVLSAAVASLIGLASTLFISHEDDASDVKPGQAAIAPQPEAPSQPVATKATHEPSTAASSDGAVPSLSTAIAVDTSRQGKLSGTATTGGQALPAPRKAAARGTSAASGTPKSSNSAQPPLYSRD